MKEKVIVVLFISILFIFSIGFLATKDRDISSMERRRLMSISELKVDFIDNIDKYLSDQFIFRDKFISINSMFDRYLLGKKDSNNIYVVDDFLVEKDYPLDEISIKNFKNKLNFINDKYLKNSTVYYTLIPDKAYFLNDNKYLKLNYRKIEDNINQIDMNYINILDLIELDDYYKTDIHIKQDSYFKVIKRFSKNLNFKYRDFDYEKIELDNFYGASYSKAPYFIKPDKLVYLENDVIKSSVVSHLEYGSKDVYDLEKINDMDKYNIYLSGPSALVEITNDEADNNKELIIFRDSFASSFTPLLIPYYNKITLVDLRYIDIEVANEYIDFSNKDVLFAYSFNIVNNSELLKVKLDN